MSGTDNKVRVVFEAVLDKFKSGVQDSVKAVTSIGDEGKKSSKKMDFVEARQGIDNFTTGVDKATSTLKTLVATYLGMKTINFLFVEPTKTAIGFEKQMSKVLAISGATKEEFEALNQSAKDLGNSTQFTAVQVAEAQTNLAVAGFNSNEIIAAMPGLLDLSASSGTDLASATEVASNTLKGFGKDASEASRVADVFAKASTSSSAQVLELGEAMKYVAPMARSAGTSLEETTAAIGLLSDAGIKGSQAGTTLRSVYTSLARPSSEAVKVMNEISFSAFDAQGNMLSLTEIVGNLETSLAGYTNEARQQALAIMFGDTAMAGMITLVENGADSLDELTQSLINSEGAAKGMADIMLDNTAGAILALQSRFEAFQIQVGERIMPKLHDQLLRLIDVIDQMAENGAIDRIAESLGDIAVIVLQQFEILLTNLPQIIESLANWIQWLANNFETLTSVVQYSVLAFISLKVAMSIVGVVQGLITALTSLKKVMLLLNAVMAANPILKAITAVGALTAAIIYLWNTFEGFRTFIIFSLNIVLLAFLAFVRGVLTGLNYITEKLDSLLGRIPLIGKAFNKAADTTNNALASIDNSIENTINNMNRLLAIQDEVKSTSVTEENGNRKQMGPVWWAIDPDDKNDSNSSTINPPLPQQEGTNTLNTTNRPPASGGGTGSRGSTGNNSVVTDNRTAFEKGMDQVEEDFRYKIDLKASRISLAQAENDDNKVKELNENKVDLLNEKIEHLEKLEDLAKNDKERGLLEIAQNRLMVQILNILDSISETTNELVGEFNKPAGLDIMNQYQYETSNSESYNIGRYISTPTVNMYMQLKERGEEAGRRARRELEDINYGFLGGVSKNDIVVEGCLDVFRN